MFTVAMGLQLLKGALDMIQLPWLDNEIDDVN